MHTDATENISLLLKGIVEKDDQGSFRKFFDHYYPRVLNFSSYLIGSKHIAEDITLEVFLKFWNNRKNIRNFDNIQNYLLVTAKHLAINYLAKNKNISFISFEGVNLKEMTDYKNPENDIINEELQLVLTKTIEQLPEKCKMIYLLVKEENLKYKEVAELLDISIKTVENQMGIALSRLRTALNEHNNARTSFTSMKVIKTLLLFFLPFV
jgi:RNA polymerase sigma-70 factor (family 1)